MEVLAVRKKQTCADAHCPIEQVRDCPNVKLAFQSDGTTVPLWGPGQESYSGRVFTGPTTRMVPTICSEVGQRQDENDRTKSSGRASVRT